MITVIYDACVLYPAPLRDLLMHLAMTNLFKAKWSNQIHDEWMRNVLVNRPDLTRKQLERTKDLMNAHALDCLVLGHEKLIPKLSLPDVDDRHVLAAAIHSSASIILTFNLRDFPKKILSKYDLEAQHPDDFICNLIDADADKICAAIHRLRSRLKNPPLDAEAYLLSLERQSLPKTVRRLRQFASLI